MWGDWETHITGAFPFSPPVAFFPRSFRHRFPRKFGAPCVSRAPPGRRPSVRHRAFRDPAGHPSTGRDTPYPQPLTVLRRLGHPRVPPRLGGSGSAVPKRDPRGGQAAARRVQPHPRPGSIPRGEGSSAPSPAPSPPGSSPPDLPELQDVDE